MTQQSSQRIRSCYCLDLSLTRLLAYRQPLCHGVDVLHSSATILPLSPPSVLISSRFAWFFFLLLQYPSSRFKGRYPFAVV